MYGYEFYIFTHVQFTQAHPLSNVGVVFHFLNLNGRQLLVIPFLNCAHNFFFSSPFLPFLCLTLHNFPSLKDVFVLSLVELFAMCVGLVRGCVCKHLLLNYNLSSSDVMLLIQGFSKTNLFRVISIFTQSLLQNMS